MNFPFRLTTSYSNCKILYFEERMKTIGMESGIQHSESGIQGVESGIRDSLGFLYMGRQSSDKVKILLKVRYRILF